MCVKRFFQKEQFLYVLTVIDSSFASLLAFVVSSRASFPFPFLLCSTDFSSPCRLIFCIFFTRGFAILRSESSDFVNSVSAFFSIDSSLFLRKSEALCKFISNNLFRESSRSENFARLIIYYTNETLHRAFLRFAVFFSSFYKKIHRETKVEIKLYSACV